MEKSFNRRSFIKKSALLGVSSMVGSTIVSSIQNKVNASGIVDIASVKGADYFENTIQAVEILGGMNRFVPRQSTVALLVNSPWSNPGSYTRPDVTLAVARMCMEAGAKNVGVVLSLGRSYWNKSPVSKEYVDVIQNIQNIRSRKINVTIPNGKVLKSANISKGLLDADVFINIPIAKSHEGVQFTGSMKNMMGATSYSTNRFFHHGSGASGSYEDVDFLSQCIADLNLVRRPDLCVFDATETLQTNGPAGPGKIIKPRVVYTGVDGVAADVYGADLLGLKGREILTSQKAYEHGMGELNLSKLNVKEVDL